MLADFALQLAFGLAWMMLVVSGPPVSAGFFRVHLLVVLGLLVLAWLLAAPSQPQGHLQVALLVAGAVLCFASSTAWLLGARRAGRLLLAALTAVGFLCLALGSFDPGLAHAGTEPARLIGAAAAFVDRLSGAWLLGAATTSMLLGHWYLVTPSMSLRPLQLLVQLLAAAAVVRGLVAVPATSSLLGLGGSAATAAGAQATSAAWVVGLLLVRWLAGIAGPLLTAYLVWQTLKIRSTQSATGILYVAVILVFLGELVAKVLAQAPAAAT